MDEKLSKLISEANSRVDATNSAREAEKRRKQEEEFARDAEAFESKVKAVLGQDVLDALAPVTFHKNFLQNSMTFEQDSRAFRLKQVTGRLVQLEENDRMFGNQFNLDNSDARDSFLYTLGTAMKK